MADEIKLTLGEAVPETNVETILGEAEETKAVIESLETGEAPTPDTAYLADVNLTADEQKMVDDFSETIDLNDSNIILSYGAAAQKKISEFSDSALEGVKAKDLGAVGKDLAELVTTLQGFDVDEEESKGLFGFLKKKAGDISSLKSRYDTAEANVDRITGVLENHQNQLLTDIVMLDKMYESNLTYFKELTMYILAGKAKLEKEQNTTLADLKKKAEETGLVEDAQKANDYAALCDRFDKKLHDLELTRTISMQMAPQIRLIQNSDTLMTEKIQSTINNTIPLWKNQMVLALGMAHSSDAMQAQQKVTDSQTSSFRKMLKSFTRAQLKSQRKAKKASWILRLLNWQISILSSLLMKLSRFRKKAEKRDVLQKMNLAQLRQNSRKNFLISEIQLQMLR